MGGVEEKVGSRQPTILVSFSPHCMYAVVDDDAKRDVTGACLFFSFGSCGWK